MELLGLLWGDPSRQLGREKRRLFVTADFVVYPESRRRRELAGGGRVLKIAGGGSCSVCPRRRQITVEERCLLEIHAAEERREKREGGRKRSGCLGRIGRERIKRTLPEECPLHRSKPSPILEPRNCARLSPILHPCLQEIGLKAERLCTLIRDKRERSSNRALNSTTEAGYGSKGHHRGINTPIVGESRPPPSPPPQAPW